MVAPGPSCGMWDLVPWLGIKPGLPTLGVLTARPPRKSHTPVFFPGESHGQRSLVGCSSRGLKESDTIQWLTLSLYQSNIVFSEQSYQCSKNLMNEVVLIVDFFFFFFGMVLAKVSSGKPTTYSLVWLVM